MNVISIHIVWHVVAMAVHKRKSYKTESLAPPCGSQHVQILSKLDKKKCNIKRHQWLEVKNEYNDKVPMERGNPVKKVE